MSDGQSESCEKWIEPQDPKGIYLPTPEEIAAECERLRAKKEPPPEPWSVPSAGMRTQSGARRED